MRWLTHTPPPLPRAIGWAVVALVTVFIAAGLVRAVGANPTLASVTAAIALIFAVAAIRGSQRFLLPAVFVSGAAVFVLVDGTPSNVALFAVCALAAWCVLTGPRWVAVVYSLSALAALIVEAALARPDPGWGSWIGGLVFSVVGCYFAQRQHELAEELRAAQAGLDRQARTEERNRIARELHDVIAHSMTVSLLHITSARLALADDPADAARALAEAERLGRSSLDEVRHAVGLLRDTDAGDPTAPLPGSLDVPALVQGFRAAGADVAARIDGALDVLPATVGLATYRIVQEALTNAAKHAPGEPVTVVLRIADDTVGLEIENAGRPGTGHGLGVTGMRERAESVGGRCVAGPGGRGWLVRAELPVGATRVSSRS